MGERKVINKYYPPDFDAAKLPRLPRSQNDSMKVWIMLPMSIRCNSCAHYIYKGTTFDMIKQIAKQKYLNVISIHTFCFKCTPSKAQIVFQTETQNSDYVVLNGANRNFEPWRSQPQEMDESYQYAMELLEKKTKKLEEAEEEDEALVKYSNASGGCKLPMLSRYLVIKRQHIYYMKTTATMNLKKIGSDFY
ncbi:uncharacterized protein LOC126678521 [Mercurialis annua]|uniref:uncharacterized protein LOC126678521 n=1 Tax=Mercurialis annua TaxID=3986 RepID=UPI002160690E|nr:uncharacterized protein LOC126678521 [Mercurialis annua]